MVIAIVVNSVYNQVKWRIWPHPRMSQQTVVALFSVYLHDHEDFLQLDCSPTSIVLTPAHPIRNIHAFEDRKFGSNQTQTAKPPCVCVYDIMYFMCVFCIRFSCRTLAFGLVLVVSTNSANIYLKVCVLHVKLAMSWWSENHHNMFAIAC